MAAVKQTKILAKKKIDLANQNILALRLSQGVAYPINKEENGWRDLPRDNALLVPDRCSKS